MRNKRLHNLLIVISMVVLVNWGGAVTATHHVVSPPIVHITQGHADSPILYPMRQEFVDSFERADLSPWTTEFDPWGIRDTTDAYGPNNVAAAGYRYAGFPADDAQYGAQNLAYLLSPTINLTGWDSLYLSFSYWGDFEANASNFDGGLVEISSNAGSTWIQIDSLAQGHLNPTYDSRLAGTGPLGTLWAYCYDTKPDWVMVGSLDLMGLGYAATGNQVKFRWTFASDDLSVGDGWFVDDVRIADTPPPDLQAPIITHTPLPDTTDTLNSYTISATVIDNGSGLNTDSIYLHYRIESGSVVDVQMDTIGTGSPDVYEADIPAQTYHTDVFYSISAVDMAHNAGTTPEYNFEVTNARTIIYDDGQPWYAPDIVDSGNGCFVQFAISDVGFDSALVHQVKFSFGDPGEFDVRIYEAGTTTPGAFVDSVAGQISLGFGWQTVELTDLDIHVTDEIVVGYIMLTDSLGINRDATINYPNRMWNYVSGAWQAGGYGDFMMRLKVIPLGPPGIEDKPSALKPMLFSIAPNPVTTHATIEYQLTTGQHVSLALYNASGQLVRTLVNTYQEPGKHQVIWNGKDERGNTASSGVYFLTFVAGEEGGRYNATEKLLLVR